MAKTFAQYCIWKTFCNIYIHWKVQNIKTFAKATLNKFKQLYNVKNQNRGGKWSPKLFGGKLLYLLVAGSHYLISQLHLEPRNFHIKSLTTEQKMIFIFHGLDNIFFLFVLIIHINVLNVFSEWWMVSYFIWSHFFYILSWNWTAVIIIQIILRIFLSVQVKSQKIKAQVERLEAEQTQ